MFLSGLAGDIAGAERALAIGIDSRTRDFTAFALSDRLDRVKAEAPFEVQLVFLDCADESAAPPLHRDAPPPSAGARPPDRRRHPPGAPAAGRAARSRRLRHRHHRLRGRRSAARAARPLRAQPPAGPGLLGGVVLLSPRPAARGRSGVRRALPEESALRSGAASAHRARSAGRPLHRGRSRLCAVLRVADGAAAAAAAPLRARGQELRHHRDRLHRRPPSLGVHRRAAGRLAAPPTTAWSASATATPPASPVDES